MQGSHPPISNRGFRNPGVAGFAGSRVSIHYGDIHLQIQNAIPTLSPDAEWMGTGVAC